jgi:hypothetical protein
MLRNILKVALKPTRSIAFKTLCEPLSGMKWELED